MNCAMRAAEDVSDFARLPRNSGPRHHGALLFCKSKCKGNETAKATAVLFFANAGNAIPPQSAYPAARL